MFVSHLNIFSKVRKLLRTFGNLGNMDTNHAFDLGKVGSYKKTIRDFSQIFILILLRVKVLSHQLLTLLAEVFHLVVVRIL